MNRPKIGLFTRRIHMALCIHAMRMWRVWNFIQSPTGVWRAKGATQSAVATTKLCGIGGTTTVSDYTNFGKRRAGARGSTDAHDRGFLLPTDETWGAILISSDQLFAGNENQVRETLRLVEEVTYDLTSQSVPRPDPVRFIPNQIFFLGKKPWRKCFRKLTDTSLGKLMSHQVWGHRLFWRTLCCHHSDQAVFTTLSASSGRPLPGTPPDTTPNSSHVGKRPQSVYAVQTAATTSCRRSRRPSRLVCPAKRATPTSATPLAASVSSRPCGRGFRQVWPGSSCCPGLVTLCR